MMATLLLSQIKYGENVDLCHVTISCKMFPNFNPICQTFLFGYSRPVYSLGVLLWEFSARLLSGQYQAPYAEFSQIQFDFQVIIQAAKKDLR